MSDSIKSRARGDAIKIAAQGLALLEGGECKGVENLTGFLLNGIGHDEGRSYFPDFRSIDRPLITDIDCLGTS